MFTRMFTCALLSATIVGVQAEVTHSTYRGHSVTGYLRAESQEANNSRSPTYLKAGVGMELADKEDATLFTLMYNDSMLSGESISNAYDHPSKHDGQGYFPTYNIIDASADVA